jgi:hypothetical protein
MTSKGQLTTTAFSLAKNLILKGQQCDEFILFSRSMRGCLAISVYLWV